MKIKKLLLGGLMAAILISPALAVLQVNFNDTYSSTDSIKSYWDTEATKSDPSSANNLAINADPNIDFILSDPAKRAKVANTGNFSAVIFGADEANPGSQNIWLRLFSGNDYTALKPFANSTGSAAEKSFGAPAYTFTNDNPAPVIYKVESVVVKEGEAETKQIKFYSKGELVNGKTVELFSAVWPAVTYDGLPVAADKISYENGNKTIVIDAGSFANGKIVAATVKYISYWDKSKTAAYSYTIPSVPGGAVEETINLVQGLNTISMPFKSPWYAYDANGKKLNSNLPLANLKDLAGAISEAANPAAIKSVGAWDKASQSEKGAIETDADKEAKLEAIGLNNTEAFQIYLTQPVVLTIKSQ